VSKKSIGLYKEKGSKFHGYCFPVQSLDDVNQCLLEVKKEHHSARHHCYAYRLEEDGSMYRANDDGEPAHSAGDPILGQIDSSELTYTLIIVVRYFGGIKLGVGGLITAYRAAARDALDENLVVTKVIRCRFRISFSYARMNIVMRLLKVHQADMLENNFEITCTLTAEVDLERKKAFLDSWTDLHDVEVEEIS
jgi:uncharacterized YigZ family protein